MSARSRGSVEFASMAGGVVEKARRWGVSKSLISNWQRGESKPNGEQRDRIFEAGGPDPDSWDEPYVRPQDAGGVLASPPLVEPTAEDTASVAAGLLVEIRKLQRELAAGGSEGMTIDQRVRMVDQLAGAADKLGKHTGVKLTTRQILASPLWAEVRELLVEALEEYPDAMRKVADALDRLRAQ